MQMIASSLLRTLCCRSVCILGVSVPFVFGGCEREGGRTIDEKIVSKDNLEILVIRNTVRLYDEFGVGYWCRTPDVVVAPRDQDQDHGEPRHHRGEGWRYFKSYGAKIQYLAADDPVSKIAIYDSKTAYVDNSLTMTFDGCRTRIYFNVNESNKFETTMKGKAIRYPENQVNGGNPFLQNMKVFDGGGCFEINPEYVDERKQYFYCSSDLGKTWTLESERKRIAPVAPQSANESDAKPSIAPSIQPTPDIKSQTRKSGA